MTDPTIEVDFYGLFANAYEELFPCPVQRATEIGTVLGRTLTGANILDAGCATGALCRHLTAQGAETIGVDLNAGMIALAQQSLQTKTTDSVLPRFMQADLLDLETMLPAHSLDAVLCLGNTLPHLRPPEGPLRFIRTARTLLAKGGTLVLQLVNFDRLLAGESITFPVLTTDRLQFSRSYGAWEQGAFTVPFQVELRDLQTQALSHSTVDLMPLLRSTIVRDLQNTGFHDVRMFADWKMYPTSPEDASTVFVARV